MIGSLVTVWATRSQLIGDIDDQLAVEMANSVQFLDAVPLEQIPEAVAFGESQRATLIISATGEELRYVPAGPINNPLPRPALDASELLRRVGDLYTVDSDDSNYRVLVDQLDDGRVIALAQPLDDVRDTLSSLGRTLLLTLFGIVALEGLIFWWLLRLSLQPYDEMIDTAQAIAGGDLDRRAVDVTQSPEIARLTRSLNTMLDQIQESFEAKEAAEARVKQFAADASHELRTPLTTIAGYSEIYLSGAATDDESVTKQMTRINSEAARMGRLVNDLLTLARLDQGAGLDLHAVDVAAIVADAVDDRRAVEPGQRLTLSSSAHDRSCGAAVVVVGDRDALQQVFVNLLANATVHAPAASVDVDLVIEAGSVVVTVSDDGPGMSPETADHVFDRFFRADPSRTPSSRSSGLGLSIVASIVQAHGGTVELDTAPGDGARFTVTLPVMPGSDAQSPAVASSVDSHPSPS